MLSRTLICFAFSLLWVVGGLGCAKDAKDQPTLEKVALAYWIARLVDRDYENAFDRELDHAGMPFEEYQKLVSRNENFTFSELTINKVNMEDDGAMVYVGLKCKLPSLPVLDRTFKDEWVYESNRWQHRFSEKQP